MHPTWEALKQLALQLGLWHSLAPSCSALGRGSFPWTIHQPCIPSQYLVQPVSRTTLLRPSCSLHQHEKACCPLHSPRSLIWKLQHHSNLQCLPTCHHR